MKKLPLKRGEGPYRYATPEIDPRTQEPYLPVHFCARAFGEQEGKPTAFIISEDPHNQGKIDVALPDIGDRLLSSHGYTGTHGLTFFFHQPENVHGNSDERYQEFTFTYDRNGPGYLEAQEVSADRVAEVIGPENMEERYLASPRKSQNPLAQAAFSSGLDHNLDDDPGHELD